MGQLVTLQPFEQEMATRLAELANNPKIVAKMRDNFPHPYSISDAYFWISFCNNQKNNQNVFRAILYHNEFVGGIGVLRGEDIYRNNAEIGYWLGEPYWGLNIMTEAVQQMTAWTFDNTDITRLSAGIFETNPASMKVLEKAGYYLEAIHSKAILKYGEVFDEYLYVKLAPSF
ncbi:GNAT family N-acetyltransferase [Dyadobacter arcticus]|uniref:RimJ/RimL family protein N-acetyltransferase n=1 Tax=Dyadobacter arcticus TaxID=1078754 RepID=A0ABX0UPJ4_9BACT|nr:GNAT family N-acetyltransferase [Dyadobacter arcticus]NIJ54862.1 RimJ/RimL family protein N-acetyltransferase [Dyadobacter arcticus]